MTFKLTTYTYQEISDLGNLIRDVYAKNEINLPPNSPVMEYINSAEKLCSSWLAGCETIKEDKKDFLRILENTLECLRLGSALKWTKDSNTLDRHLKFMLKGFIDPTNKERTRAKDFCFELQMTEVLTSAGITANLVEPPDIVFNLEDLELVIACKCAYSPANLEKNIKKATRQIRKTEKKGLIALSIDALVDHSKLLQVQDDNEFYNLIDGYTTGFIKQYERQLPYWIGSRNVIGIIVSLSTLTLLKQRKLPSVAQYIVINPRCSENSPYYSKLLKLTGLLEDRNI